MSVRVQDRRRVPFFMVGKPDLARLADSCDSRSLPFARSVYFALLEIANDQRCEEVAASRTEVASKAGVSVATVKRCAPMLAAAGLIETREVPGYPNVWTLLGGEEGGSTGPTPGGSTGPGGRVHESRGSGLTDPPLIETGQEEKNEELTNGRTTARAGGWADLPEEMRRDAEAMLCEKRKVSGRVVSEVEMLTAAMALAEFNRQLERSFSLGPWLDSLVARVREHRSWPPGKFVWLVTAACRVRWWERNGRRGRPEPRVIFGSAQQFDRCRQEAEDAAAGQLAEEDMNPRTKVWPDGRRFEDFTPREQANIREQITMGVRPWRRESVEEDEAAALAAPGGSTGRILDLMAED